MPSLRARKKATHRSSGPCMYFQAIPLFFASDASIQAYFAGHRDEIDALSGDLLVIPLPREVEAGDAAGLATVFTDGQKRYPGLQSGDLPCFWLEDGSGQTAVLRLPDGPGETIGFVRRMVDAAKVAKDAKSFQLYVEQHQRADAAIRIPLVGAVNSLQGSVKVASWEKTVAVVCGVLFVAAILVLAVAFPVPTPFQYLVFRIVLSIAAAGFVSMTPGFLNVELPFGVKAGGALAVFVIVFFFNPASIVTPSPDTQTKAGDSRQAPPVTK